ncbi:PREDICTED: rust resistance kinase Lr10 [Theobroma cacao]|uniref:Rust resistance kinase Lr10 n=1 Tax=Theobroma cacao TaxID=3641 RepID=A0AB32WMT5_THECC|nr:PREDICTED: rust resistance kinase Lr10 [Theobroma cacao]
MPKPKARLPLLGLMALALFLLPETCSARSRNKDCGTSLCGNVPIRYPFRLKSQPRRCGDQKLELQCENNNLTTLVLEKGKFFVQDISYENYQIRVVDASLGWDNCSLPLSSVSVRFSECGATSYQPGFFVSEFSTMFLVNCTRPIKSSIYVDASRCSPINSSSHPPSYFYFLDQETKSPDFNESCTVIAQVPIMLKNIRGLSTSDIYRKLLPGFEMSWKDYNNTCYKVSFHDILAGLGYALRTYVDSFVYYLFNGPHVSYNSMDPPTSTYIICLEATGGIILPRILLGISCLVALVTYKLRRRHLSMDDTIEEFIQSQHNFMPIRYSFREIKRMTRDFRDKLGEGGYGSVFKAKLRSGHFVAIKLLNSKANGQDFINEVASIGRIHHVNVAKLIGFCVEGSKQALIYEFMPNGSLDRIIFAKDNKITLSWQKMFDIALGVARGIEYLHRGCDMQILHFDIKPHNILLDKNFIPKVSDFGLAKLYSVADSVVSLTAARGTVGYMAPELVYQNIGGISYKADVYSFGMLLLEIVGKRKNLDTFVEQSSQIYFPSWIYDQFDQRDNIEFREVTDDEKIIVKKMVITAFWCIQLKPIDRPSMSRVLEMLETDIESLEMPPKPFQYLLDTSSEGDVTENPIDESTASLHVANLSIA